MALFAYKAADRAGKVIKGVLEAEEERAVAVRLREMGYIPIQISGQKQGLSRYLRDTSILKRLGLKRISLKDLLTFTQDFAFLLSAGLPIDRALGIEIQVLDNDSLKSIVQDILRRVKGGAYLSDALSVHKKVFPELYINMVRTGESAGRLADSLERLGELLRDIQELRSHIFSALLYPLFILGVSGISIVILLTFVIPKFSVIFSDMQQAVPLPTQVLLFLSDLFREAWIFLAIGCVLVVALVGRYVRTPRGRERMDGLKLRMPIVGKLVVEIETSRFTRALGVLLSSGVPMLQSLLLAQKALKNEIIKGGMERIVDRVKEGENLSSALKMVKFFPPLAHQMIVVGEETGKLHQMLLRVAEHYEGSIRNMIKRLISLLEPTIILVMGLVVGFIVISMLLGIFSINELPF